MSWKDVAAEVGRLADVLERDELRRRRDRERVPVLPAPLGRMAGGDARALAVRALLPSIAFSGAVAVPEQHLTAAGQQLVVACPCGEAPALESVDIVGCGCGRVFVRTGPAVRCARGESEAAA